MAIVLAVFIAPVANAQPLTGTLNVPGDYATIALAVAALNTMGVGAGGVTFNVAAGHMESSASQITLTATGTAANPIVFQKNGEEANPLVTRTDAGSNTTSTFGGLGDAVIQLNGSDYVTIDGIDVATSDQGIEYGYFTYKPSATDGCQFVSIMNCAVTMTKGTSAYVTGIYISNGPTLISSATGVTVSANSGRNENVTIIGNTISNVHAGIALRGSSATTFNDQNPVVGQSGMGNIIQNYGGGASSTTYGVYLIYQVNPTIAFNTIDNAGGGGSAHASTLYGIFYSTAVTGDIVGSDNSITLNTSGTSGVQWIYNGNTSTSVTINNNTLAGAIAATTTSYLIYNSNSAATSTSNGNVTSGTILKTGASGLLYGYYNVGSPTSGISNVNNNDYSNITLSGTSSFTGIRQASAVAQTSNVTANTISNIICPGAFIGIEYTYSPGDCNNNAISGITGGAAVTGILIGNSSNTGTSNIYDNSISTMNSTGASNVTGIQSLASGTGNIINIHKNIIHSLSGSNASSTVYGLSITAGKTVNAYNNLIGGLAASVATGTDAVRGISITMTTTVSNNNIDYNTIYLNATGAGNFGSSGIFHTTSATATTSNLTMRNNIIVNLSTPNGTGLTVAYRRSNTTLTNYGDGSNNNLFFAGSPTATSLIFYDGTNSDQTLGTYIDRVSPRDLFSVTENPTFLSTNGANANFLHIDTTIPTLIEGGGAPVAGITDDYDGDARNGSTPDIGADEFAGTTPTCTGAPAASNAIVSPPSPVCSGASFTLSLSQSYMAVEYQWQSSPDNNTWTDVIGATFETLITSTSVPIYYRAVITCVASAMSTNSGSVFVTFQATLNGIYTINNTMPTSGTNYISFVDAIDDLSCRGVSGPVTFNVTAGQVFLSGSELNISATGSMANTITFVRSGAGANPLIRRGGTSGTTDYILRIGGGDYITFDGIDFEQTGTSATDWVEYGIYIQNASSTDGAKNNTFRNGTVVMTDQSNQSTGVYVHASPTPTSVDGTNSSNRFLNMTVQDSWEGYRINGVSAFPDDGNEINTDGGMSVIQNLGDGTSTGSLYGVIATHQMNLKVKNTEIANLTPGSTSLAYGIALQGSAANSAEFSGNHIHDITGGGTVNGIQISFLDTADIFNNRIHALRTTTATSSAVRGIDISATGANVNIYANQIYDISSDGLTTTTAAGIEVATGLVYNIHDNMISDIRASTSTTSTGGTRGIWVSGGSTGSVMRIYHNTIMLSDTGAVAGYTSAGIHNSSATPTLDIRNNIVINKSNVTTGTRVVAFSKTAATDNVDNASNNNLYYAGTPGAKNLIYYDGTTSAQTIAEYIVLSAIAPGESFSVTEDVAFAAITDGILRPNSATPTLVESSGVLVAGYESDFENTARGPYPLGGQVNGGGFSPDLGADEGDFTMPTCAGTPAASNALVSPTPPFCNGESFTLSLSESYAAVQYQWQSSPDNSMWTDVDGATFETLMTSTPVSTYYRAVITCVSSAMSTNSTSVLVPFPTNLNGVYTIDNMTPTGGTNYNSFVDAIDDINCRGVSGPVTFSVVDGQVFPETSNLECTFTGTFTNTITFQKQGAGTNPKIRRIGTAGTTDYILKLTGVDYYTFSGIDFEQTGTSSADWVEYGIWITNASATNGGKNNTIKNGVITLSNANTGSKGGFISSAITPTALTGTQSDNSFINMNIASSFEGYRITGATSTYMDDGNKIETELMGLSLIGNLGDGTASAAVYGVFASYQTNFKVKNTEISNLNPAGINLVYGITLQTSSSNTSEFSGNEIHDIVGGGTTYGIYVTLATLAQINNNEIYDLTTNGTTSAVRGIHCTGTGVNANIYNNRVYSITSNTASTGTAAGIDVATGLVYNISNNMVSDISAPSSTTTTGGTRGISVSGGSTDGVVRIYHNTILLTDAGAVAGYTSAGIHNSSATPILDIRNNIVINKSNVNTGTRAVAFWKTSATDNVDNASNTNLYYAGIPGAKNLIYYNGTTSAQTIAEYNVLPAIAPGEAYSVTEDVAFAAITDGILRPNSATPTLAESGGIAITGYTSDFENQARGPYPLGGQVNGGGFNPDLGADEGDFIYITTAVPDCPTLNEPANGTIDLCPYQSITLTWTPAMTGGFPLSGYDVFLGTSMTPPFVTNTSSTSYTLTGLSSNETYYWRIVAKNGSGSAAGCTPFSFSTSDAEITSTTPAGSCSAGSLMLGASGTGTLSWYAAPVGGTALGTGTVFNTPVITESTDFYVGASSGSVTSYGSLPEPDGTSTTDASNWGLVFDATQSFTLESVEVYSTAAGNVVVNLTDNVGTVLQTVTVAVTAAGATTAQEITLNFNINPGIGYRLIAESSPTMVRDLALGGFPYSLGANGNVTSGYINGTSTTYYYFYNWKMVNICESPRVPVTAAIHDGMVVNISNADPGSLRANILCAVANDVIMFDVGLTGQTITLMSPIVIDKNLTILGLGMANLTLSGGGTTNMFQVLPGVTLTLEDIALKDGFGSGAIDNQGSLSLEDVLFENNLPFVLTGPGSVDVNGNVIVTD